MNGRPPTRRRLNMFDADEEEQTRLKKQIEDDERARLENSDKKSWRKSNKMRKGRTRRGKTS